LPADGGTTLVDEWTIDTGLPWPIAGLARGPIRSAVATNLEKLRELLEVGETRLPDGRISRR
jgi:adenine deaminase